MPHQCQGIISTNADHVLVRRPWIHFSNSWINLQYFPYEINICIETALRYQFHSVSNTLNLDQAKTKQILSEIAWRVILHLLSWYLQPTDDECGLQIFNESKRRIHLWTGLTFHQRWWLVSCLAINYYLNELGFIVYSIMRTCFNEISIKMKCQFRKWIARVHMRNIDDFVSVPMFTKKPTQKEMHQCFLFWN